MECGAAEFYPELLANETSSPVARHQILRRDRGQASIPAPQDQIDAFRALMKVDQFRSEPCLGAASSHAVCAEIIPQLLLEDWLAKRVAPRVAIFFGRRANAQKTRSSRAKIIGTVT